MHRKLSLLVALVGALGLGACGGAAAPRTSEATAASSEGYGYEYSDVSARVPGDLSAPDGDSMSSKRKLSREEQNNLAAPAPEAPADLPPTGDPAAPTEPWLPGSPKPQSARAPLLIYEAELILAVFETQKQLAIIQERAKAAGGYLVRRTDSEITIRVPAKEFAGCLDELAKLGDELHRQVTVKDVTAEFTDLEIRLQNARAVRERLEELLARASKIEEALAVERELERVSGEIERMLGQLKLMSELTSFSTITVRFEARATDQVQKQVELPFPWLHELGLPSLLAM